MVMSDFIKRVVDASGATTGRSGLERLDAPQYSFTPDVYQQMARDVESEVESAGYPTTTTVDTFTEDGDFAIGIECRVYIEFGRTQNDEGRLYRVLDLVRVTAIQVSVSGEDGRPLTTDFSPAAFASAVSEQLVGTPVAL